MLAEAIESTELLFLCLILTDGCTSAPSSFIYSLRNNDDLPSFKSTLRNEDNDYAIWRYSSYGPTFGWGYDLYIANDAESNTASYARLGYTYNVPVGYLYGQSNTDSLMGGSHGFTPSEVEVLYLN